MSQYMKNIKFTTLAHDLIKYLGSEPTIIVADGAGESKNILVKTVVEEISTLEYGEGRFTPYLWREDLRMNTDNLKRMQYVLKKDKEGRQKDNNGGSNVFWNLFLIAIDDDIYNKEAENVADLAAIYHFTPEMMEDWCNAVNYVLTGKQLSKDCDLVCQTIEGKWFFLHQR